MSTPGRALMSTPGRALMSTQNIDSLFFRDEEPEYIVDWGLLGVVLVLGVWGISLVLYLFLRGCLLNKNDRKVANDHSDVPNRKDKKKSPIKYHVATCYAYFHEGAAIILHILISLELTFYAMASFKAILIAN